MNARKIMIWIFITLIAVILMFNFGGYYFSAPKYHGPVSDHFNGKTFINPGHVKAKGLRDVIRWASNRSPGPWTEIKEVKYGEKPVARNDDGIRITFVNHSTFLIQVDGVNILTDPIWSERTSPVSFAGPKRMRPPGIRFEDLPPIDAVILSHNHYDHLDVPTMKKLIKTHDPEIITPLGVGAFIKQMGSGRTRDMDWWEEATLPSNLPIVAVPAQHFSGRGTFDRDATLWCGYVIKSKSGNVYFAGDSGYGEFFKTIGERYGEMAISLIPIGAYLPQWFMSPIHISPEEAVQVHKDVRSRISLGMHFGTFPLADDGQEQPQSDLQKALNNAGLTQSEFIAPAEGKAYIF
ncbi:MAG: MBL fold metallo-hydrolase [Cyclobacteriaceae bacterium]|nr:MBL fold metallo-hydrolase [Cyclobacteriaceae bacterium]